MIELLLWMFIVAVLAASFGFMFGVVFAGERAFESGRQQGHRDARKNLPTSYEVIR